MINTFVYGSGRDVVRFVQVTDPHLFKNEKGELLGINTQASFNQVLSEIQQTDFDYEFQMALANKSLAPNAETVFITARPENMYISSSLVRQIASFGGDISDFVPAEALGTIETVLKKER